MRFCLFIFFIAIFHSELSAQKILSPTALDIFRHIEQGDNTFLQPASSGRIQSAMFGMVRNNNSRFHEGIDICSVVKMENGTPMDLVYCVYPGVIAHLSPENNGSYGRYVVLLHRKDNFEFYTLYGHLLSISPLLKEGDVVRSGTILGMLGQTSTVYQISKSSAHLHFEIGIVLGGKGFDSWFLRNYGQGNLHGYYNGFNLVGADPIDFYTFHSGKKDFLPEAWLKSQQRAFTLRYLNAAIPDILKRSPGLCKKQIPEENLGWEIDFTWFGLPVEFRPVNCSFPLQQILNVDASLCRLAVKRGVLSEQNNTFHPGKTLKNYLEILFDSSFGK